MDLAHQLCLWADELRAVASNGLQFSSNPYDRANYERIGHVAAAMFAWGKQKSRTGWLRD